MRQGVIGAVVARADGMRGFVESGGRSRRHKGACGALALHKARGSCRNKNPDEQRRASAVTLTINDLALSAALWQHRACRKRAESGHPQR